MNKVYIHTEFIKLQQVLKLAGLIDQGSDVKYFLSQGKVLVNGELQRNAVKNPPWGYCGIEGCRLC